MEVRGGGEEAEKRLRKVYSSSDINDDDVSRRNSIHGRD